MEVKMEDAAAPPSTSEDDTITPSMTAKLAEKSPYDLLKETKSSVEDIITKMLSFKKDDKPNSDQRELITQMFLHFVNLRQANRKILMEEDRVKAETERAKAPVDSTTLQLHNLMYEKSHYLKAIKACKDFKSKYPDIQLVNEAEFFSQAPEEFKGSAILNDTAHNVMLKRLNYELFQRKELCKLREKLEQMKKSYLQTIANRKKFLSSLPSHLKALKKASLPAQNQLGLQHTKKQKQLHAAELLPPPLYIIYSQFMAQKEAFGENMELEIIGSLKDAQVFVQRQINKNTGMSSLQETSRIDDDVMDEEDDGQRRRKRPKKVAGKENVEAAGIYQTHPLRISLHVYDDDISGSDLNPAKLVTLKFEYLFKLNVVCVGVEGSDEDPENSILCNLFPDDKGLELPQQSAKLLLGDEAIFDERRTMRPYKWAQHLAGIDFLPDVSPSLSSNIIEAAKSETGKDAVISGLSVYRQQNRVQTVVQRVRSRKKAQLALAEQLDSLMNLSWPSLTYQNVPWAAHEHLCSLHKWLDVGSTHKLGQTLPSIDVEQCHDSLDANMAERASTSKEEVGVVTEDGELPSLIPEAIVTDDKSTANLKVSGAKQSKQTTIIPKIIGLPIKAVRNQSFGRYEEDTDLMLDSEIEVDDSAKMEMEMENECAIPEETSWVDYGVKEYILVLTRKRDMGEGNVDLEAKISISMEYPIRPPLFRLSLLNQSPGGNSLSIEHSVWYNELRAMEVEVNVHILKMLPLDQENYILSHQVHCLAMFFDLYLNEASEPAEGRKCNTVIDIGLCNPVSGELKARSFRGRDRRKMLSWKDMQCTPAYPF